MNTVNQQVILLREVFLGLSLSEKCYNSCNRRGHLVPQLSPFGRLHCRNFSFKISISSEPLPQYRISQYLNLADHNISFEHVLIGWAKVRGHRIFYLMSRQLICLAVLYCCQLIYFLLILLTRTSSTFFHLQCL